MTFAVALAAIAAVLAASVPYYRPVGTAVGGPAPEASRSVPPFSVAVFSYNPNTVTVGSSTNLTVQLSGGTSPFFAWLNSTPSGCAPSSVPYMLSSSSSTFQCSPTTSGSYNVQLDVADSSTPTSLHAHASTQLTVNSNGGNGNGNGNHGGSGGNGSSSGFSLPSGLIGLATIFVVVFLVAFVAIAAGAIATAVAVSRGLKRLNKTMAENRGLSDTPRAPAGAPPPPK